MNKILNILLNNKIKYETKRVPQFSRKENGAVLVLGNGPSFKACNWKKFKDIGYDILVLNDVLYNEDLMRLLKPRYGVIVDHFYFDGELEEKYCELCKVLNVIDWGFTLVVPIECRICKGDIFNDNVNIEQINMKKVTPTAESKNEYIFMRYRYNLSSPATWNVLGVALYYLVSSGVKTIMLSGVEMSMFLFMKVNEANNIFYNCHHFYDDESKIDEDIVPMTRVSNELRAYANMFEEFETIKYYSDWIGRVRIINMCKDSYIDAFEKMSEDSAIDFSISR